MTETESGAEFISEAHVRHILRYVQAKEWLSNEKIIMDAACGTGYGSRILSRGGYSVLGVDSNEDAIKEAVKNYYSYCTFMKYDLLKLMNSKVGAIVSIETLEHFNKEDGQHLLKVFGAHLEKYGILIVSTPYCTHSGPSPITKQHLWEYSLTDFEQALVAAGFEIELMKLERHEGKAGRLGYAIAKCRKVKV